MHPAAPFGDVRQVCLAPLKTQAVGQQCPRQLRSPSPKRGSVFWYFVLGTFVRALLQTRCSLPAEVFPKWLGPVGARDRQSFPVDRGHFERRTHWQIDPLRFGVQTSPTAWQLPPSGHLRTVSERLTQVLPVELQTFDSPSGTIDTSTTNTRTTASGVRCRRYLEWAASFGLAKAHNSQLQLALPSDKSAKIFLTDFCGCREVVCLRNDAQ